MRYEPIHKELVIFSWVAILAVLSFSIQYSETIGKTNLSRSVVYFLAWTLAITGPLTLSLHG